MDITPEYIGITIIGAGLVASFVRNGRSNAKQYGNLEQKVDNVDEKLDHIDNKLDKQTDIQTEMKVRCAEVSSAYGQKIKGLEGEVFGKRERCTTDRGDKE